MPKAPLGDPTTPEYWNLRVATATNDDDMIFLDPRRGQFWERVHAELRKWHGDFQVLDVACGFGRFAKEFDPARYQGFDFSEEMLKLARERNPFHTFHQTDVRGDRKFPRVDVVFEVNSLRSLGLTAEEFIAKFRPYAKIAVACLEADRFTIENLY